MSSILVYFENSKLEVGGKILSHLALFKTKIAEQVPENLKRVHCLSALTSSMLKSIFYQQRIVKFCTKYAQAHRIWSNSSLPSTHIHLGTPKPCSVCAVWSQRRTERCTNSALHHGLYRSTRNKPRRSGSSFKRFIKTEHVIMCPHSIAIRFIPRRGASGPFTNSCCHSNFSVMKRMSLVKLIVSVGGAWSRGFFCGSWILGFALHGSLSVQSYLGISRARDSREIVRRGEGMTLIVKSCFGVYFRFFLSA